MRRTIAAAGLAAVLLAALVAARAASSQDASAAEPVERDDVVMLRCDPVGLKVVKYLGSTESPAQKSDSCPQAISLLLRDGFRIKSVGYGDEETEFALFTLLR